MSESTLPAIALAAMPGRRRQTLEVAKEIERRGYSYRVSQPRHGRVRIIAGGTQPEGEACHRQRGDRGNYNRWRERRDRAPIGRRRTGSRERVA